MNSNKRNQLIGFITLLLLALIFSPYIFTDKTQQLPPSISLLEPSEESRDLVLNHDVQSDDINTYQPDIAQLPDNLATDEITHGLTDNNVQPVEDSPSVSASKNEHSYAIQLVALKNKQKIEELIALLKLNNYDVFTIPTKPVEGQLTKLLVGNYATKEQAELVIIDLEHLTKLKGFITSR